MIDHINKQAEPYDGFAGFSQGFFIVQLLYKAVRNFGKQLNLRHALPTFVIDFAAAKWDFITFDFVHGRFVSGDVFIPSVHSIHYRSEKDPLYAKLNCAKNFETPIVIEFEGGHRPPKILNEEAIKVTADFLAN